MIIVIMITAFTAIGRFVLGKKLKKSVRAMVIIDAQLSSAWFV